jgi:hypothetical protein
VLEDLEWFLPVDKAAAAMKVLDVDGDGKVSLSDIRDAVVGIYRERRNLAFTLKDTSSVINKLEFVFAVVIHFVMAVFYLVLFRVRAREKRSLSLSLSLSVCVCVCVCVSSDSSPPLPSLN